ncbi:MAG: glutathione S-transferase family protein [Rhodospirillaceae bacterium]|nr:glutathione S-transferase family protein [Rhodospirillaceae bacterium]
MIKIYGSLVSRATRNLWALEELDLDYEHVSLDWAKQKNRSPEYLKINPAGKVPTLTDGNATLSESLGINLYLAQKYGQGGLWPDDDAGRARCVQWSFWAGAELEPLAYGRIREFLFKKEAGRDQALITDMAERTGPLLNLMTLSLAEHTYLAGETFTLADLNVACVVEYLERSNFDFSNWPKVESWYTNTYGRAANQKIQDQRAPIAAEMMKRLQG